MTQVSALADRNEQAPFDPLSVLAALPFAVFAVDQDTRIRFMNGAAEQFFEQGASGLTGRRLNEVMPADSPLFSLISQASSGQTSVAEYGVEITFSRDRTRNLAITAAPLNDDSALTVISLHEQSIARRINSQIAHRNASRSVTGLAALLAHETRIRCRAYAARHSFPNSPFPKKTIAVLRSSFARKPTASATLSTGWACFPMATSAGARSTYISFLNASAVSQKPDLGATSILSKITIHPCRRSTATLIN